MKRLDAALTRLEVALVTAALAALAVSLTVWVGLKGLSSQTTSEFQAGLVFRAAVGASVLGALTWWRSRRPRWTTLASLVGLSLAPLWKDFGVEWAGNVVGWLQDGSLLTWLGGLRGVATRLTLVVAMGGAALATSQGRHVAIDFAAQWVPASWKRWLGVAVGIVSASVCWAAAWGFADFIAIDAFRAPAQSSAAQKVRATAHGVGRHWHQALMQLWVDVRVAPRVLSGARWDTAVTGAEWNAWAPEFPDDAIEATRTPLLSPPGESPRGVLVRDFNLVLVLGFVWLGLRFVLKAGLPSGESERRVRRSNLLFAVVGALLASPLFVLLGGFTELAWLLSDAPLNRLAPRVLDEQFAGSPVLVTIPLFTALGYVLAESDSPRRIVSASRALFGWLPGGLALVCLAASAFFTSLTGGSGVTIVAIGGLLYPTLRSQGYGERFSLGLVTTGGSLGLLLPPSLPILVYALVAGLDFTAAFKAGLLPALLVMVVLGAWSAWVGLRDEVPRERFVVREAVASLGRIKWELGIPVVILGSLGTSLATLEESAALALMFTVVCALGIHRDLPLRRLPSVLSQAIALAGAVTLILVMANALMNFVIDRQVPARVLEGLVGLGLEERWQFLIVLNVFLLVVGMVMDGFSALIVAVPLVLPFAARFGLHPFHLAMMVLLNLELAFCMPPLGLNLFISSFRFERPVASLYRAVMPFVGLLTVCLVLVMAVPWVSTVLVQPDIDQARAVAEQRGEPPREAWLLECVQEDALNPKPCTEGDRLKYAAPDAGEDELDDALLKEMME